jgi:hypothetical protein
MELEQRPTAVEPEGFFQRWMRQSIEAGIEGWGPIRGAAQLAEEYAADPTYRSADERVAALIRWETARAATCGFVTGLGGLLLLPLTIPASLWWGWMMQARMVGAIAHLYGWRMESDRLRTVVMMAMVGEAGREAIKATGVVVGNKLAIAAVKKMPLAAIRAINKAVGFRLLTKFGRTGLVNLSKIAPLAGGLVGALVDGAAALGSGRAARTLLQREEGAGEIFDVGGDEG